MTLGTNYFNLLSPKIYSKWNQSFKNMRLVSDEVGLEWPVTLSPGLASQYVPLQASDSDICPMLNDVETKEYHQSYQNL